jgi:hypothetical protein
MDNQRIWQTGGARGENQHRRRLGRHLGPQLACECSAWCRRHLFGEPCINTGAGCFTGGVFGVRHEQPGYVRQAFGGQQIVQALLTHHHGLGGSRHHGMRQGPTTDLGIDKGRHHTEFGQAKPTEKKLRAVLQGHGADVARAQTAGMENMCHLVGTCIDLGITQALFAVNEERALGETRGLLFQPIGDGVTVRRFDLPRSHCPSIKQTLSVFAGHGAVVEHRRLMRCIETVHS